MNEKLLIVWASSEIEVAKKLILLYGGVALSRKYWDELTIMIWGPSAKLLAENEELQEKVKELQKSGVKFNACVICTNDYGVSEILEGLNIELTHTGEILTHALKNDIKVITF